MLEQLDDCALACPLNGCTQVLASSNTGWESAGSQTVLLGVHTGWEGIMRLLESVARSILIETEGFHAWNVPQN